MTYYSMKDRQLSWMYVNHARKEYLSGNFLIVGERFPLAPASISAMISPESAVGAAMLMLITPYANKETGETVSHSLRGIWAGHKIEVYNCKTNLKEYTDAESNYTSVNLDCVDYLRAMYVGWDKPFYDTLSPFFEMSEPQSEDALFVDCLNKSTPKSQSN